MVKITGCIVTYNNINTIKKCVSSILENTHKYPIQLYISDNGSNDGTVEWVQDNYCEVKIIKNEFNLGFGYGHNQILSFLNEGYHFVINPDIYIEGDVISELIEQIAIDSSIKIMTPQILNFDGSIQYLPKRFPTIRYTLLSKLKPFKYLRKEYTRENENIKNPTKVDFCTGCFFCIESKCFLEMKGFDERYFMYFEDADLSKRVRENYEIIYTPLTSVYHTWHRDNARSMLGIKRYLKSLIQYFCKWGWKF